ncbi:MAG: hypothetical protein AAFX87_15525 [Bacteroidota bacterium]
MLKFTSYLGAITLIASCFFASCDSSDELSINVAPEPVEVIEGELQSTYQPGDTIDLTLRIESNVRDFSYLRTWTRHNFIPGKSFIPSGFRVDSIGFNPPISDYDYDLFLVIPDSIKSGNTITLTGRLGLPADESGITGELDLEEIFTVTIE